MTLETIQARFKVQGYNVVINPDSRQAKRVVTRYQKLFPEYDFENILCLTREDTGAILALVIIKTVGFVVTRYRLILNGSASDILSLAQYLNTELVDVSMETELGSRTVLPTVTKSVEFGEDKAFALIITQQETISLALNHIATTSANCTMV